VECQREDLDLLVQYQAGAGGPAELPIAIEGQPLTSRLIYRCVSGSRAYGLEDEHSDTDYRGIYLPTAEEHWSLAGVPDQLERHETQEHYWELERFLRLALKANPNVLECLYSPLVELATPLACELLAIRGSFLSKLVYQTYNGYVLSQFKKMQADLRKQGRAKPKHVMHLIRLLIAGIEVLRTLTLPVKVVAERDRLLAIKRGELEWPDIDAWRRELHQEFTQAWLDSSLPERPDEATVDRFLIRARRAALAEELP